MRDAVAIVRGVLGGGRGRHVERPSVPAPGQAPARRPAGARRRERACRRWPAVADGCLTPSITTPAFVRYTCNVGRTSTSAAPSAVDPPDRSRQGTRQREIAGMYLADNIAGAADTLLDLAGIELEEIRPVAEAMEQGGRLGEGVGCAARQVDRAATDCIAAIEEYRDAGCRPRDARALGRGPARADPPVRRAGAPARPRLMATVVPIRPRPARRPDDRHRFTGDAEGMG